MIHKLFAGKGKMKRGLSLLLCLALLGSSVISANVTAEAESEVSAEESMEEATEETTEEEETEEEEEAAEETEEEVTVEEAAAAEEEADIETSNEKTDENEAETVSEAESEEPVTDTEETTIASDVTAASSASAASTVTSVSSSAAVSITSNTSEDSEGDSDEESSDSMPAVTLEDSVDGITVSINAPEGAFAEGVSMKLSSADVEAFEAAVLADCEVLGDSYTAYDAVAVNISFYDADGNEIQPETAVEVTLSGLNLATEDEDGTAEYALIYHMDDDGNVMCIEDQNPGQEFYTFTASSFSTYGVVNVSVESGISTVDDDITYTEEYTVMIDKSITISKSSSGTSNNEPPKNLSIANYEYEITEGDEDGVEISERKDQNGNITSLTVTGVTEGTVVVISVKYSDGSEETYKVTVTGYTVDHIDIQIATTATLVINGETLTENVTLEKSDYTSGNVTLSATQNGETITTWSWDTTNIDNSTDTSGKAQLRVSGTYPIGTADNPVIYTLTLTKYVTFTNSSGNSYTVLVTFTTTFSYWDSSNACPGVHTDSEGNVTFSNNGREGMDFTLGSGSGLYLEIIKYVYDENGDLLTSADGISYTFDIYDSDGKVVKTVTIKVNDGIGVYEESYSAGSYYVIETSPQQTIGSYNYNNTTTSASGTLASGESYKTSTTQTVTLKVTSESSAVYTINNYYKPTTASVTITKKVTGNMGDTTKEFTFTLTDESGTAVGTDSNGDYLTKDGFTLSSGESTEISGLTVGSTVYLSEIDNDDYKVTVTDANGTEIEASDENGTYAITVGSDVSITVENYKNVDPDTGIDLDSLPYILMLAGVAVLGGVVLFRRRRKLL